MFFQPISKPNLSFLGFMFLVSIFSLLLLACGGGGGNTTVNNSPTISGDTFTVNEDAAVTTSVGTVTASDPDTGDTLTYSIIAGNIGNAFAIDYSTGEITVNGALDRETLASYSLTVQVSDGTNTDTATITIDLTDSSNSPTFNDDTFAVNENAAVTTYVGTVTASNPDIGDTLTYSITAGNTGNAFAIDSSTGEITVNGVLDYETLAVYSLTVQVSDGTNTDTATITINLIEGGTLGSVVIGFSREIQSVFGDTAYQWSVAVFVADSNGDPVPGAAVIVSLWPIAYYAGDAYTATPEYDWWGPFDNEDDPGRNLNLDVGEDLNDDGQLTPGISSAGSMPTKVNVDENGVGTLNWIYLKEYNSYITAEIKASTYVFGSETTSTILKMLTPSQEDVDSGFLPPSPFSPPTSFTPPTPP